MQKASAYDEVLSKFCACPTSAMRSLLKQRKKQKEAQTKLPKNIGCMGNKGDTIYVLHPI